MRGGKKNVCNLKRFSVEMKSSKSSMVISTMEIAIDAKEGYTTPLMVLRVIEFNFWIGFVNVNSFSKLL